MAGRKQQKPLLLGRYEVGRLLGQGNFAKVYHARNAFTGEEVAIKVTDKEMIFKSGLVAHIKREIAVLRRVRHPNIVRLHEVMATKSKIYFVMEFVRGGELFNHVAKGRLQEDAARRYFQQLVSAMAFCHARGVYHRDIKPENLLVDEHGDLKVSDFGLSAVAEQIRQDGLFHTFCGTPSYVAPEVLARRGYDAAKADIWSCGVLLFVLMAGYPPFHDASLMQMYRKIYRGEFRCPRWFSPELVRLVRRILDTNTARRITIPDIMENRWFKKGFKEVKFYIDDKDRLFSVDGGAPGAEESDESESETSSSSGSSAASSAASTPRAAAAPGGMHSSASSPSLIETAAKASAAAAAGGSSGGARMRRPTSLNAFDIISFSPSFDLSGLFEERGEETRFVSGAPVAKIIAKLEEIAGQVSFTARTRHCQVSLEATRDGQKGALAIAAEVFELTPELVVVEVRKKAGDKGEYEEFCNRELKPGLRSLMYDTPAGPAETDRRAASDTES